MIIMGKVGKLVSPEELAIAEKNGIPKVTVYKRLDRGWDVQKAITKSPRKTGNKQRDEEGQFTGVGKGQVRSFTLPVEWDEKLTVAIADSGKSQTEWLEETIINKLKRQKKSRRSK